MDNKKLAHEYDKGNPYRNLWAAVIHAALVGFGKKKDRASSINFFTSNQSSLPWICRMLGIPLEKVLRRAKEVMDNPQLLKED